MNKAAHVATLLAVLLVGASAPGLIEARGLLGVDEDAPKAEALAKMVKSPGKATPAKRGTSSHPRLGPVQPIPASMKATADPKRVEHIKMLQEVMRQGDGFDESPR